MEQEKKSYPAIDCFKFICCILIIAIHAKPFEQNFWLDSGVGLITRFAVPYFFVATGFFFFKAKSGQKDGWEYLIRYELRMLRLYLIWYIIQNAQSMIRGYIYSPWYYVRHFVIPNNGSILWFLPATMSSVFFVYVLSKKLSAKSIFAISIIVWFSGYIMSTLAPIFAGNAVACEFISSFQRYVGIQNGLFFGFPYIALANLLSAEEHKKWIIRDVVGVIVFFVLLGAESFFVVTRIHPTLTFLWLSALPLAYFTFNLTLSLELKNKPIFLVMRKLSTLVYVIHPIALSCIKDAIMIAGINDLQNLVLFLATCLVSIGISYFIYRLSQNESLKFFKYLM